MSTEDMSLDILEKASRPVRVRAVIDNLLLTEIICSDLNDRSNICEALPLLELDSLKNIVSADLRNSCGGFVRRNKMLASFGLSLGDNV